MTDGAIGVARVVFVVTGGASLVVGGALAWPPLGWAVAGILLVTVGLAGAVRPGKG
jgi:hypothetical protein